MSEEYKKYSNQVFDLSIKRIDMPIDIEGGNISVISATGDCFIKLNEKSQDPINLLHINQIKGNFEKIYLSNNIQVGNYIAFMISAPNLEFSTNITRNEFISIPLPSQNIPQHLIGRVLDRPAIINIWDIGNATFRHSFDFSPETTHHRGLSFSIDGRKMYIIGRITVAGVWNGRIFEYDLSKNWNISTATFRHSLDITPETITPFGLCFNDNGTLMYAIDRGANRILQYNLSIGWDISTATLNATLSIPTDTANPNDILYLNINSNGYKMYLLNTNDILHEYNLNIAWDITTATHINSFDMTPHLTWATSIFLSPDGLKSYVLDSLRSKIVEFRLLRAWDITTSIYNELFDFSAILEAPRGLVLSPDGKKMFIGGENTNNIYEFDL